MYLRQELHMKWIGSTAGCLALVALLAIASGGARAAGDWDTYGGDGGRQFTSHTQIAPDNVERLAVAWTTRTGDLGGDFKRKGHSFQANPVLWGETLYVSTSSNQIVAVDATSGAVRWQFDPRLPRDEGYSEHASRGVSVWHGASEVCPSRVFVGTLIGTVHAVEARTGEPCSDFGVGGRVDLSFGVGEVDLGDYGVTSPPAVLGDRLIVGSAIGDNRAVESDRGIVRALDARTGAILWQWDPIPRDKADPARASWGGNSADITGSANAWAPVTVDAERDLVFVSTGSPSPDFYGGERPGDNRYANSLVALRGSTGEVVWHYQFVHHDVWDYDVPAQPTLATLHLEGRMVPAVLIVTKTGMLFAFHRETGEPVYGITEVAVPQGGVPGEVLSPTQPFSAIPALADQSALAPDDAYGFVWFDRRACASDLERYRSEGIFTPPSLDGTVMNPGYGGGANWGGVAVDEGRLIAVANVNQLPALVRLIPRDQAKARYESGEFEDWQIGLQTGTPYVMVRRPFLSPLGLPCTRPPWGKLVAVDLAKGAILWQVPLGTIADLAPGPVPNLELGVPNLGGALMTASGLVVIGAAAEHALRAFSTETGTKLWETRLPAAAMATPMSYAIDGRQYIVIAAGGHASFGLEPGDYLIAFALAS
jgi:quinoprotein glucose dehydrogenase